MMPDLDGWDVYKQLKAYDLTKNVPVIIITAKSQAIDRVLGLHIAKVDDYISKPFRPQELLDSIEKILSMLPTIPLSDSMQLSRYKIKLVHYLTQFQPPIVIPFGRGFAD